MEMGGRYSMIAADLDTELLFAYKSMNRGTRSPMDIA